jgi:hypothetical protein
MKRRSILRLSSPRMRPGKIRILGVHKSAIRNPQFVWLTSNCFPITLDPVSGAARHIEADLILMLPNRRHPLYIFNRIINIERRF